MASQPCPETQMLANVNSHLDMHNAQHQNFNNLKKFLFILIHLIVSNIKNFKEQCHKYLEQ